MTTRYRRFLSFVLKPLIAVLALALVMEEWLWDTLKAQVRRLSHCPPVQRMERHLQQLPPWACLLVLVLPGVALIPFKLAGLWALAHGHPVLGLGVFITAKLTGTALAAYLFDLVRERARQMPWFNAFYVKFLALIARAKAWLSQQPVYLSVRHAASACKHSCKAQWQRMLASPGRRSAWQRRLRRIKHLWTRR